MNNRPFSSLSNPLYWGAFKIAGLYLLIGSLWILFSDRLAERIALNKEMLVSLSLYKGWAYVIITAVLLYWLIQRDTVRLHVSEKQLQVVINALPVLISYVDKNRHYQFTNEAYEEWFGEKAQGKRIEELIGDATYQKISKYVDKALNGETVFYETEIPYQDGGERFVSATYIPDIQTDGQVRGFFALVQDISEQKESKEKLHQWADAFEGCAHGIAISDPDTNRIVVCNPAFANMHKCRVENIVGTSLLGLYAPSDHEHVRHNIERADQIGHVRFEAQMTPMGTDKSVFPVQMDLVSVLGEDGELIYRVATAQDISERKQAEEGLRRFELLSEHSRDIILFIRHKDGRILEANAAAVQAYGYSRQELLALTIQDLRASETLALTADQMTQANAGGILFETSHRRKDGTTFPVEVSSQGATIHGVQTLISIIRDITERKQAEEQLERNNQILNEILDSIQDDFYVLDRDWNFVYASRLFTSKIGKEPQDFIGNNIWKMFPKHLGTVLEVNFREAMEKREIRRFEVGGKYTTAWYRMTAFPSTEGITILGTDITEHQHAEEELKKSEERYRYLFQNNPYPMWIYDRKTLAFLDVNEAAITKYGYSRQEFLQMTIMDIRPPEDIELLRNNLAQPRRPLEHSDGWRHYLRDGTLIYVEITSHTLEMDGHESVFVIAQDITQRKQAEEALRESEQKFSIIYYKAPFAATLSRLPDGVIVDVNEAFERTFGYSKQEIVGKTSLELGINPDAQGRTRIAADLQAQGVVHDLELMLTTKSGVTRVFLINIDLVSISGQRYIFQTAQDITERKQAEEALQKAHAELEIKVQERTSALSQANSLLQALMDYVPDQIYFKDLQCRFIRNSRSQADLLGLNDPREVIGKTDFDFFPHAAKAFAEEQEVMKSGKSLIDFEEWVVWPDGRESWVSTSKVPLRNSEGETIGIFGISRDITERKHAEQAIRELNSDLENQATKLQVANKELEAFSYSVSHDLRAPLRAIDGYTRILVEDYEAILDAEGKRVCGIISAEARRMGQLIDDLLAFSRLGRKEMYSSNIDMKALVVSVLNELIKEEDRERIDFKIARLPSARADASLMRQVWVNLLSNALKFTSKKERALIEVGSKSGTQEVTYYVRDSGAGFDMEYANKLFGVFQRLHSESEFEGTGVGLAIVQRIIRRHDGRVWAEGEIDKGATFYFALPRKENSHE